MSQQWRAAIRCEKSNGDLILNDAVIEENNTVTVDLTAQIFSFLGDCNCTITLFGIDAEALTTTPCVIKVIDTPANDTGITSKSEFTLFASIISENQGAIASLNTAIQNKVDKVASKGLSSNDFTNTLKTKLGGLSNYTHPTSGVSAGAYKSVMVDAQGQVTGGSNPTALAG